MLEFVNFKALYSKLTIEEKRFLGKMIKSKSEVETVGNELVEFLEVNPNATFNEVKSNLYQKKSDDSLRKNLDRLTEKICDVLINREQILSNQLYDKRAKNIFLLLRQLLITDILTYRGLANLTDKIVNKVINEAAYYEHFDILVYALGKKLHRNQFQTGSTNELEEDIHYYHTSSLVLNQFVNVYFKYLNCDSIIGRADANKKLPAELKTLTELASSYNSKLIRMYLFQIQIQFLLLNNHFSRGISKTEELLDLITEHPGLYSNLRMATALLNKALFHRLDFSITNSISILEQAQKLLPQNTANNFILYEQFFLAHFFSGNILKAKYYVKAMEENRIDQGTYKLKYYSSSIILTSVNDNKMELIDYPNDSDGSFLNIYIRILNIIKQIQVNRLDTSTALIENLRKFLNKSQFRNNLPLRIKIHLKLLLGLDKEGFGFDNFYQKNERLFYQLTEPENAWQPQAYELIVLEEWMLAKVEGKEYNHSEVMAKMKRRYSERKSPLPF
jgi:hypothetical protein